MKTITHTPEQIIKIIEQAEKGEQRIATICREHGMSENTCYRVRKAYGTAAVVMLSYTRLWFLKKFLGQAWYDQRIIDLHLLNAERVETAILQLKDLFIKLGQIPSTLCNFLH